MACVKGDAYGHGMVSVAESALRGGADRLSVAHVEEGIALRKAGIQVPIQILIEPPPDSAGDIHEYGLIPSLSSPDSARALANRLKGTIKVHVEVDTGMHRVPLQASDVPEFVSLLLSLGKFEVEGIFSHFTCSHALNEEGESQLSLFRAVLSACETKGIHFPLRHMANTGAVAIYPNSYFDMIRPGYALYGYPIEWIRWPTKPALSWLTRVSSVIPVKAGECVGYNSAYTSPHDTRIAILGAGYADGYPRALSNLGHVVIRGRRAPVVGLVCMNQMMVDVGYIPGTKTMDVAMLIGEQGGEQVTASELARYLDTTAAEITCRIAAGVERHYQNR